MKSQNGYGVRKTIAIMSMIVLSAVALYCLVTGSAIPDSIQAIITSFVGYIGYYFGKSTALDAPNDSDGGSSQNDFGK
jgi:hypothetical protein